MKNIMLCIMHYNDQLQYTYLNDHRDICLQWTYLKLLFYSATYLKEHNVTFDYNELV